MKKPSAYALVALLLAAVSLAACRTETRTLDVGEPVLSKIVGEYDGDLPTTFERADGNGIIGRYLYDGDSYGRFSNCRFKSEHDIWCSFSSKNGTGDARFVFAEDYRSFEARSKFQGTLNWSSKVYRSRKKD